MRTTLRFGLAAWVAMTLLTVAPAHGAPPAADASAATAEGEIRKVDRDNRKLTLKHGPIAALDMPPMTMVFHVAGDVRMDGLKPGETIRFTVRDVHGKLTITGMEPAR